MNLPIEPLHVESLKDACIARLEELILSGELKAGERLPAERNLAVRLGVSRPVLPEPGRQAARTFRRFVTSLEELDEYGRDQAMDEIADSVVVKGNGENALDVLEELARLIRARLERR